MTEDDVEKMLAGLGSTGSDGDGLRALASCPKLRLFWIENTADRKLYVLAKNSKYAKVLARQSGHLHDEHNGKCYELAERFFEREPAFGSAIKRAMKSGIPGVVERKGNYAVMGNRIYAPITLVK